MHLIKIDENTYIHRERIDYITREENAIFEFLITVRTNISTGSLAFTLTFLTKEERDARFEELIDDCQRLGLHK